MSQIIKSILIEHHKLFKATPDRSTEIIKGLKLDFGKRSPPMVGLKKTSNERQPFFTLSIIYLRTYSIFFKILKIL